MEITTFNLDINLNEEQTKLLNKLADYTDYSIQELITDVATGKDTWENYRELLEYHEYKNNPKAKYYSMEEVEESLRTGIILE